jgi:peptidoglycan/LPS O-acetylase OafA/YrhL
MNNEIKPLTGLRGLAALIVVFYHFFEQDTYFQSYVPSLIKRGYLGVDVGPVAGLVGIEGGVVSG